MASAPVGNLNGEDATESRRFAIELAQMKAKALFIERNRSSATLSGIVEEFRCSRGGKVYMGLKVFGLDSQRPK